MKHIHLSLLLLLTTIAYSTRAVSQVVPQGLPVMEVNISEKNIPNTYTPGTMRLGYTNGDIVELNAKFKTRGATALKYTMKPSFNMKLQDENGEELDSTLCGLRSMSSWILDAMAIDRINMRNRVAFDIWNDFSQLPYETDYQSRNGTIGQFVEMYINGTYKGIYCLTDRINRKLLNLKKPQVEENNVTIRGIIYKHGTNSIGNQNSVCFSEDSCAYVIGYHDAWELTEPEEYAGKAAWAPLDTIYMFKNDYEWIKEHFFLEQLADYQIFIMALSISDNWGNKNSFISVRNITADGNKRRFTYSPWDLDTSLGGHYDGDYYDGHYSNWLPSQIASASTMPVPFSVCQRQADYRTMLKEAWSKGREGALSVDSIRQKMYRYRDLFVNSGAWDRQTQYWETQRYKPRYVMDLNKEVDLIVEWYENRFDAMDQYFGIDPSGLADLRERPSQTRNNTIYNMMGVPVNANTTTHGVYIRNGRKFVK